MNMQWEDNYAALREVKAVKFPANSRKGTKAKAKAEGI